MLRMQTQCWEYADGINTVLSWKGWSRFRCTAFGCTHSPFGVSQHLEYYQHETVIIDGSETPIGRLLFGLLAVLKYCQLTTLYCFNGVEPIILQYYWVVCQLLKLNEFWKIDSEYYCNLILMHHPSHPPKTFMAGCCSAESWWNANFWRDDRSGPCKHISLMYPTHIFNAKLSARVGEKGQHVPIPPMPF